jgi:uncharacterized protein (UPF0371 family)
MARQTPLAVRDIADRVAPLLERVLSQGCVTYRIYANWLVKKVGAAQQQARAVAEVAAAEAKRRGFHVVLVYDRREHRYSLVITRSREYAEELARWEDGCDVWLL